MRILLENYSENRIFGKMAKYGKVLGERELQGRKTIFIKDVV